MDSVSSLAATAVATNTQQISDQLATLVVKKQAEQQQAVVSLVEQAVETQRGALQPGQGTRLDLVA